jgi:energy-coupling factor transport system ATP-binding protein
MTPREVAAQIAIVFQDFEAQLFTASVEAEIAFGPECLALNRPQIRERVEESLRLLNLAGLRRRSPSTLSGGQQQRLAVAAAWALRPAIILLDEPLSDLDDNRRKHILGFLKDYSQRGGTAVVAEHDTESLVTTDRTVIVYEGRIVGDGATDDVLRDVQLLKRARVRPPDVAVLSHALAMRLPWDPKEAARRLMARCYVKPEPSLHAQQHHEVIAELRHVTVVHNSELPPALSDVNVEVRCGEILAIVGPNGSGKTTTAKVLAGLMPATSGSVWIGGRSVASLSRREVASQVGFVFQNPDDQLFSKDVLSEVLYGPRNFCVPEDTAQTWAREALADVGLENRLDTDPFALTKGERQRVAVASVLAMRPTVVVLDEPTTGLDHYQQQGISRLMRQLNAAGSTIVLITHSMHLVAELADRVVVLADGHVVHHGDTLSALMSPEVRTSAGLAPPPAVSIAHEFGVRARSASDLASRLIPHEAQRL